MNRVVYFVYRTTNKLNGKYYIGAHCTSNLENDTYLGSGDLLRKAIRKYGKENFSRTVLEYCSSMTEAYEKEALYVTEKEVLDPNCYNLKRGGLGGMKGTTYVTKDGVRRRILPQDLSNFIQDGWKQGIELPEETIKKLQESARRYHKGIPQSQESNEKRSKALKGKPLSKEHRDKVVKSLDGNRFSPKGTKIMFKGQEQIRVPENLIDRYKQEGYQEGYVAAFEGCKGKFYVEKEGDGVWVSRKNYWRYIKSGYRQYTIKQLKLRISQGEVINFRHEN